MLNNKTQQKTPDSSVNVTKKTTLNIDLSSVLIDSTLSQSASVMYIRQATYYYLLMINGWTRTDLHKAIKTRASVTQTPYNKGVLVKESLVSEYAITGLHNLFIKIKLDKKNPESIINKIADIMQKNKIAYNYLKDVLVKNPKESTKTQDSQESAESQDSQESKKPESRDIDFDSVVMFIKHTSQANRLKLANILAESIKTYVDNKKNKPAKKAA